MELNVLSNEPSVETEGKTMAERVTDIYDNAFKTLSVYCKVSFLSMQIMQSLGYNGFKRWHRIRCREFHDLKMRLANELFDRFRIKHVFKEYDATYSPADVAEHLTQWQSLALDSIKTLGSLNIDYFNEVGMKSEPIGEALCLLSKDYEKIGRLIMRFTESDWLAVDMHTADDRIHAKCKEAENERRERVAEGL